jgi:putative DNA primase/helicase
MTIFDELNQRLLSNSRHLLETWFPNGKWVGKEFRIGNLAGDPGQSLSVNHLNGLWCDYATGDSGGDLISLFAAKHGLSQGKAAKELDGTIASEINHKKKWLR